MRMLVLTTWASHSEVTVKQNNRWLSAAFCTPSLRYSSNVPSVTYNSSCCTGTIRVTLIPTMTHWSQTRTSTQMTVKLTHFPKRLPTKPFWEHWLAIINWSKWLNKPNWSDLSTAAELSMRSDRWFHITFNTEAGQPRTLEQDIQWKDTINKRRTTHVGLVMCKECRTLEDWITAFQLKRGLYMEHCYMIIMITIIGLVITNF